MTLTKELMTPLAFVEALSAIHLKNVFNPYWDICGTFDTPNAAANRRTGLLNYLQAAIKLGVDTIWMARDLGHRGGRRTGLALTDEKHLPVLSKIYPGANAVRSTTGPAVNERTATEIWAVLRQLPVPPLLWNVFPLHPHEPDDEFTNRRFTAMELRAVDQLNWSLVRILKAKRIVAIGQDAARYAQRFEIDVVSVRHPSYGGVMEFRTGIERLYALPAKHAGDRTPQQELL